MRPERLSTETQVRQTGRAATVFTWKQYDGAAAHVTQDGPGHVLLI